MLIGLLRNSFLFSSLIESCFFWNHYSTFHLQFNEKNIISCSTAEHLKISISREVAFFFRSLVAKLFCLNPQLLLSDQLDRSMFPLYKLILLYKYPDATSVSLININFYYEEKKVVLFSYFPHFLLVFRSWWSSDWCCRKSFGFLQWEILGSRQGHHCRQ